MRPAQGQDLEPHKANVRAISVDSLTNVVYTAGDDKVVKVWAEASNGM